MTFEEIKEVRSEVIKSIGLDVCALKDVLNCYFYKGKA